MISKAFKLVAILACISFLFISINLVFAQNDPKDTNYGLTNTVAQAQLPETKASLPIIIGQIVGAALSFIGVIFFVLVVYGGFKWMTAQGNDDQVKQATSIITQATIGLIIVSAAYLITQFVGETVINSLISAVNY